MRVTIQPKHSPEFVLVDFTHLNTHEVAGDLHILQSLEGWFESVNPRIEAQPDVPGVDGMFWPEESFLSGRIVTIRGTHAVGDRSSTLSAASFRDRLASMAGQPVSVHVADASGRREVSGYVASAVRVTHRTERVTGFTIIVSCPDPLKYGSPVNYAAGTGVLSVENTGTGDVAPVATALGRVTNVRVARGSQVVEWQGDSEGLVLDIADGVPRNLAGEETGVMVWADPLRVPPGVHELTVISNAELTLTVRPGWK